MDDKRFKQFILYGVTFDAVQSLYRPFALMYLERLGAPSWQFFLFNSLPALFSAFALIPALLIVKRTRNERQASTLFFILSRLFLLTFIVVPLLPLAARPMAFLILFSMAAMPEAAGLSGVQSFIGHVFTPDERARAISSRSRYGIPLVLVLTVGIGLVLRYAPGNDAMRIVLYQVLFAFAFLGGILEIVFFRRIPHQASFSGEEVSIRAGLSSMLKNKAFLGFFTASLVFHFAWQLGWPLFGVYHVKYLKADEAWYALFNVVSAVTMFFSYKFWEFFQKRFGLHLALIACTLGQAMNPFFIGSATELWMQAVFNIFTAFFTAGIGSVFLNALLQTANDAPNRITYLAVYNTLLYISQVISQQFGNVLYEWVGIRNAIYFDGVFRLVGSGAFVLYALRSRRAAKLAPLPPDPDRNA